VFSRFSAAIGRLVTGPVAFLAAAVLDVLAFGLQSLRARGRAANELRKPRR
jgi:hypothetical protein